jgi:hypothetical protein
MANPISLPPEIVLGIATIKASGVDPNDFNNAVQELYNRGYGQAGKWIQDNKDLYIRALQDGFVPEGTQVPNSEESNTAPVTPDVDVPTMGEDPVIDAGITPEPPALQEARADESAPNELPTVKHRSHK